MCEVTTFETRLTGTLALVLNSCLGRSRVLAEVAPKTKDKSRKLCVQLLRTPLPAETVPAQPGPSQLCDKWKALEGQGRRDPQPL